VPVAERWGQLPPHRQSIRPLLAELDGSGELLTVEDPVDPVHELASYLWETARGPAVVFERVQGHTLPVFGNLLNSRGRIARGLGVSLGELHTVLANAPDRALEPVVVGAGACQEVVLADPDLRQLPVPSFFAGETGPYITAGVIVAKGVTGKRNASFARLKILDGATAFVGIAPEHHLSILAREAAARGRPLEVAITIGNHTAVLVAAAYYLNLGDDELEVAGALLGEPLEVVSCGTVDLEVPAECEIVIEGTLDARQLVEEGPVSEFSGLYESYGAGPVVSPQRITMRDSALFQTILPGYAPEHVLIGAVAIAAVLERRLRQVVPSVRGVAVTDGGCGRMHAVVALSEPSPGDASTAIREALGAVRLIKQVTAVDADIDIHDAVAVEWALATRMKADRDLLVLPAMSSSRSDPLATDGRVAKLGIDATRRTGDRHDWTPVAPPEAMLARARERVAKRTIDDVLGQARAGLHRFSPEQAAAAVRRGALLVDIRPAAQRATEGEIPGALVIERNVLEWRFDPTSAARIPAAVDHDVEVVIFCSEGYTSSLAAASLQDLGLHRATDLDGGFHAWKRAGLPVSAPGERAGDAAPP
jgi:2,5-furandicarboxylate decarboxylase 1